VFVIFSPGSAADRAEIHDAESARRMVVFIVLDDDDQLLPRCEGFERARGEAFWSRAVEAD